MLVGSILLVAALCYFTLNWLVLKKENTSVTILIYRGLDLTDDQKADLCMRITSLEQSALRTGAAGNAVLWTVIVMMLVWISTN